MAFEYQSENGLTLTPSQQKLLEDIENLPFPYGGITKLKDLRKKSNLKVVISDKKEMNESWKTYLEQYWAHHDQFFSTIAAQQHQGEIGNRRYYINLYEIYSRNPIDEFQPPRPLLGIYNRTYRWWTGMRWQKVGLVKENIEDYARKRGISADIVFGFVFIQQMMHAYYDAFNSKGFPSMLELEYPFAEFGMLSFIDSSPAIRSRLLTHAMLYTVTQVGTRPKGFGFGAELFDRAGDDAPRLISRYRDVSNWMGPRNNSDSPFNDSLRQSSREYFEDPSDENAEKYYENILGVLNINWTEPADPLQPAIGQKGKYDK